jgi:malate dehydrogenase
MACPVICREWQIRDGAGPAIDDFSRGMMDKTLAELEEERAGVAHLL